MFARRVGIDLGTANVLVYIKGKGIIINEPSVVALNVAHNEICAIGIEAYNMIGRTPETVSVIRPMRDGVIADFMITERMLHYFLRKACGGFRPVKPEVMICIPAGITTVEERAVRDAAERAGFKRPEHLIPEPLAAALGANMPIAKPGGNMVVDIGGGTTDAAIISMYGIVVGRSVRVGGDRIDDAIAAYVRRKHNLLIGERTAEEVKKEIGCALPRDGELLMEVRGRDLVTGLPRPVTLGSREITQAIAEPLANIVATVKSGLEETPPELASDIIDRGIVLTGGGALLRDLDKLLAQETGVPCYVADDPISCVAVGAGIALEELDKLKINLRRED